ncbi:MAG: hypothetical protein PHR25_04840 [Clostridia bacterium]|nr:hypothetical protein [Clostridia bacterium]MDD4376091.1 hypothetical protein [Clostridia bacterium]
MNNNDIELKNFINLPDTISLYSLFTPLLEKVIRENPNVHLGKRMGNFAIIYVNKDEALNIVDEINPSRFHLYPPVLTLLGTQDLDDAGITPVQNQPYLDLDGTDVILGFIDTGIDYTKEEFQYEDGTTRIKYLWDQTIDGIPPEGFFIGTEYTDDNINEALKSTEPFDIVPHQDTVRSWNFSCFCSRWT